MGDSLKVQWRSLAPVIWSAFSPAENSLGSGSRWLLGKQHCLIKGGFWGYFSSGKFNNFQQPARLNSGPKCSNLSGNSMRFPEHGMKRETNNGRRLALITDTQLGRDQITVMVYGMVVQYIKLSKRVSKN